ncbi:MAG: DUF4190 domain-containing protein [Sumerlaeia bacterium]
MSESPPPPPTPSPQPGPHQHGVLYYKPPTSGWAIAAMTLGFTSLLCSFLTGIPALIAGIIARVRINRSGGQLGGGGYALTGILLGIGTLFCSMAHFLAAIAVPNFLEAQVRAKVSRTRSELRVLSTALDAYRVDERRYPPDLDLLLDSGYYITAMPQDPFSEMADKRYGYWTNGEHAIVAGQGPDMRPDLVMYEYGELYLQDIADGQYDADFIDSIYDPTNGTVSYGDILRPIP